MGEQMMFPNTIEEFIDDYKFIDKEKVYTNGSELIQVYRIKQCLDYYNDKKDKEIQRLNNIIDELEKFINKRIDYETTPFEAETYYLDVLDKLKELRNENAK